MGQKAVSIDKLDGWLIDYVVGQQVCDRKPHIFWTAGGPGIISLKFQERGGEAVEFFPSSNWADCGPLLEQFNISLKCDGISGWTASVDGGKSWSDLHPLRAAMLALIASRIDGDCYIPTYK
jgi:hypothetical protein